jgi:hypothetical protein
MWPDHDGDERWWIKPLADRVRGDETVASARLDPQVPSDAVAGQ